ncbi:interferon-induced protein with tetratricopeptide repeats 3-like [Macrotis lagotis]|uniref:interferon-induced protein with tetratricopeptide repeats 3-like n=1 Tax=Macrotis lagotis TaxID=92651 RepID=UPI003D681B14
MTHGIHSLNCRARNWRKISLQPELPGGRVFSSQISSRLLKTQDMSEVTKEPLEVALKQLSCPFTWNLFKEERILENLEEKIINGIGFFCPQTKASGYNLLAYLKHQQGQNEEALGCLKQAEEVTKQEHPDQVEVRSLVTWGNYAWLYYHMGQLDESRAYLDKVSQTCRKFANPYRIDCPEMDCEEGWIRLKCGSHYAERSKACFERALEKALDHPEPCLGLTMAICSQDEVGRTWQHQSLDMLKQTVAQDPDNSYLKVFLALKLQKMNDVVTGERLVKEALEKTQSQDVFRMAAKFYRNQGSLEKAISLFEKALEYQPVPSSLYHQIGCCYRNLANQLLTKEKMEEMENPGTRERVQELLNRALDYMEKAVKTNVNFPNMYSDLASMYSTLGYHEKAEATSQKVLKMEQFMAKEKQQILPPCRNSQDYFRDQEDIAIHHYLQFIKNPLNSPDHEKIKSTLKKIAYQQGHSKPPSLQTWRLLGFLAKLNKEERWAMECYEKALGILLQNSTSAIASLFPYPSSPKVELENGQQ